MNLKLLVAIKESGLKQWQIAKTTNIPADRLSRILNESASPATISEKEKIAEALNKKISEIWD